MVDLKWSEPQITGNGKAILSAKPTKKFWQMWRNNKGVIKARGISVAKNKHTGEEWMVQKWMDLDEYYGKTATTKDFIADDLLSEDGLLKYQIPHTGKLLAAVKNNGVALDGSDTGTGKCLSPYTPVIMFSGEIKIADDLKVGDLLMGDDNLPRKILSISSGTDDMYEVTPVKGDSFICNKPHILTLRCTATKKHSKLYEKNKVVNIPLNEYLEKNITWRHNFKLFRVDGIELDKKEIPFDPYIYGIYLADGTRGIPNITKSKDDKEIVSYLRNWAKENKYILNEKDDPKHNTTSWRIVTKAGTKNPFRDFVKSTVNVDSEKFILEDYLYNSKKIRLNLLAGLLDGDGHYSRGCYEIITKFSALKEGIIYLVRSLGFQVSCSVKIGKIKSLNFEGKYYRIIISGHLDRIPLKLKRKQASPRKQIKNVLNTGFNVKYIGTGRYVGFTLDGNGRFLLGDFTVTHNTFSALAVARELGMLPLVMCPKSVIINWWRVADYMGVELLDVQNYEQYKTWKTLHISFDMETDKQYWHIDPENTLLIIDEAHRMSGRKTINSEMLVQAKKQGLKILLLSATIADSPLAMRSTGYALGLFELKDFWKWTKNYGCVPGSWGGFEFIGDPSDMLRLHNAIYKAGKGSRIAIKDLGDQFPDNQILAETYTMDTAKEIEEVYQELQEGVFSKKESRKKIKELQKELKKLEKSSIAHVEMQTELNRIRELEKEDADHHLVVLLRARQKIETLKVPTIVEMTNDIIKTGNSVAIFVNFKESVKALMSKLKTKCVVHGAQVGKKGVVERQQNIDDFQSNKENIIICNIKAGGVGISLHDLHGRPRISLVSPTFSAKDLIQVLGRIHRVGSKSPARQRIIFAAGTIEEQICKAVQKKIDNIHALNDGDLFSGLKLGVE